MKTETPADLLEKIHRNARAYAAAEAAGDLTTAQRLAEESAALFTTLGRKVPLREQFYREQAREWRAKADQIIASGLPETESASPVREPAVRPGPPRPPHQVFISYSKPDAAIARNLCSYLEERGFICWIAPRDVLPGADFPESIVDAIDSCRVVVLILSQSSNSSRHVIRELTRAVNRNLTILPFRIEDVLPTKNMDYLINVSHWLDAFPPPAEQYFGNLVETIRTHMADDPAPPSSQGKTER